MTYTRLMVPFLQRDRWERQQQINREEQNIRNREAFAASQEALSEMTSTQLKAAGIINMASQQGTRESTRATMLEKQRWEDARQTN